MIYVSIIEDDAEIRKSINLLINNTDGYKCISSFGDCETALKEIPDNPPDVLLMDITLPGMSGIEGVRRLKEKIPDLDIIMLTVHGDDELVFESLCAGAFGYLLKNIEPDKLIESIKEVREGGAPMSTNVARQIVNSFRTEPAASLTQREVDVLTNLCKGQSYKRIAGTLKLSEGTIHFHMKNIYKKLQVHSKTEAVAKALKQKLV